MTNIVTLGNIAGIGNIACIANTVYIGKKRQLVGSIESKHSKQ